jgi:Tol biopolymer transport system component/DNA-binding winged helix-turn-helix (wHTH) protein
MGIPANAQRFLRFGQFEADLSSEKLYRRGRAVHVQDKPFQILVMLVDQPGQVVTREELRKKLWDADTFVEFDEGLNAAIGKLRSALGDSADRPVFVETVRGRGYRWIAPVQRTAGDTSSAIASGADLEASSTAVEPSSMQSLRKAGIAVAALAIVVMGTMLWSRGKYHPQASVTTPFKIRQLTTNSGEVPVRTGAISPDGSNLAYSALSGVYVKKIATGETAAVPLPSGLAGRVDWQVMAWFPDNERFIADITPPEDVCLNCEHFSAWILSATGGAPLKLRDDVTVESISPDGSQIAYTANLGVWGGHEIWVMSSSGGQPRKLYETAGESWMRFVKWSPDGRRLAYVRSIEKEGILESRDLKGGPATTILSLPEAKGIHDYLWSPDGRIIYGRDEPGSEGKSCNYWEVRVDPRTGRPIEQPRPLTNWAGFVLDWTSISADGKRLAFVESAKRSAIRIAALENNGTRIETLRQLTFTESWNQPFGWTSDSNTLVFGSNRDGLWGIYKQSLQQDSATPIVTRLNGFVPHGAVTLDGPWVLYIDQTPTGDSPTPSMMAAYTVLSLGRLMRVSIDGGRPEPVPTGGDVYGVNCASHSIRCVMAGPGTDHKQIVFSLLLPGQGRGRELARFNLAANDEYWNWQLSPDGAQIAIFEPAGGKIYLLSFDGRPSRQIRMKDWNSLYNLNWAADGKSLFVSNPTARGSSLLRVDLRGNTRTVFEQKGGLASWGIPSPDGRRIAMVEWNISSNVWMLDDF